MANIVLTNYIEVSETSVQVVFAIDKKRYVYELELTIGRSIQNIGRRYPKRALNIAKKYGELLYEYKS